MEMDDIMLKIRRMQEKRGWSEAELARRSNVPQTTISSLRRTSNIPTIPTLNALCGAFGTTISEFLSDSGSGGDAPQREELLNCWEELTCEQRQSVLALLKSMTNIS